MVIYEMVQKKIDAKNETFLATTFLQLFFSQNLFGKTTFFVATKNEIFVSVFEKTFCSAYAKKKKNATILCNNKKNKLLEKMQI
jgi:hypothetical protein